MAAVLDRVRPLAQLLGQAADPAGLAEELCAAALAGAGAGELVAAVAVVTRCAPTL